MAKNNNLQDFLTNVANAIRTKTGATEPINAQNFSTEILNIQTGGGGGNTLKNLLDATKSTYLLFYQYKGVSVDDLIQPNDTENVTNMTSTFSNCPNLTTIPQLNTGNVNNMSDMFSYCYNLAIVPQLNTSKVTNMNNMFFSVPIETIPQFDVNNVNNMNNIFYNCSNLKSILMTGMKVSFDIHWSTRFERSDLLIILNNLGTVTTTQTLKMGATNLAKLTDEDKAIATGKGWTLA